MVLCRAPAARRRRREADDKKEKDNLRDTFVFHRKKVTPEHNPAMHEYLNENNSTDKTNFFDPMKNDSASIRTDTTSSIDIELPPSTSPGLDQASYQNSTTVKIKRISQAELEKWNQRQSNGQATNGSSELPDVMEHSFCRSLSQEASDTGVHRVLSERENALEHGAPQPKEVHVERISRMFLHKPCQRSLSSKSVVDLDSARVDTFLKANRSGCLSIEKPDGLRKSNSVLVTRIRRVNSTFRSSK